MKTLRLAVIVGTRPEAIKMAPLILAARERPAQFEVRVIRTGQHRELVDQLMDEFGLAADVNLDLMQPNQDLAHVMAASVRGLADVFARDKPDWVLVQGDTTTTFAGALAAFYAGARIGHVEAGLRTGDMRTPFPEEANRSLTARLADLHFAPTEQARANLLREGIAARDILVTGNTVIDMLLRTIAAPRASARSRAPDGRYLLVTAHRRENHGPALDRICDALATLLARHPDLSAWVPMHPSPKVREVFVRRLGQHPRVRLDEPLGYTAFVTALAGAALVLSDSGGIQEECAAIGMPVGVLRDDTERPEAVAAGVAELVGTDAETIAAFASRLLDSAEARRAMGRKSNAFGDGSASLRILDALIDASRAAGSAA